jgi:predicted HTH transcriptional regulator
LIKLNQRTQILFLFLLNPDITNKEVSDRTGISRSNIKTIKHELKRGDML